MAKLWGSAALPDLGVRVTWRAGWHRILALPRMAAVAIPNKCRTRARARCATSLGSAGGAYGEAIAPIGGGCGETRASWNNLNGILGSWYVEVGQRGVLPPNGESEYRLSFTVT